MPYLMGGFPDAETSRAVIEAYADAGADLIELGVPFSDPLADGPVIHAAATKALAAGATFDAVLEAGRAAAERVPVIPMVYANMVLARGAERYAAELAGRGMAGTIIPDLPPEEADEVRSASSRGRPRADPADRANYAPGRAAPRSAATPRASSTSSRTRARPASATACPRSWATSSARSRPTRAFRRQSASESARPIRRRRSARWPTV